MQRDDPAVADDEVLVDVPVAGLNPADLQQREGRYPAPAGVVPDVPGLEVAGSVVDVGAGVTRWSPGDRVFGLVAGGGLASRVSVHEQSVTRVPEQLDDREAAASRVFITATTLSRPGSVASRRPGCCMVAPSGGVRPARRHGRVPRAWRVRSELSSSSCAHRRRAVDAATSRRSRSSAPTTAAWTWCSRWRRVQPPGDLDVLALRGASWGSIAHPLVGAGLLLL